MEWIALICAAIGLAGILLAFCFRHREKKTLQRLDTMLTQALQGEFIQHQFDESLYSAVENKMAEYLSSSQTSANQVRWEKEKIKTLIADISHQTKTPLSNILLYAELLEEEELLPQQKNNLNALKAQAKKLQFLIEGLVKISRLESGVLVMHPKEQSVLPMMEKSLQAVVPKAKEKQIELQHNLCEAQAVFDAKWTEEAVCNLLDNAIKYTPTGGKVTVSTTQYELFCRIDVADTGTGIAPEQQAKIFERFYRLQPQQEGVGIGLYLVRQIASAQGGYVKVKSVPGEGAVFSLFLPRD